MGERKDLNWLDAVAITQAPSKVYARFSDFAISFGDPPLVSIDTRTGEVTVADGKTPNEAARAFWEAVVFIRDEMMPPTTRPRFGADGGKS